MDNTLAEMHYRTLHIDVENLAAKWHKRAARLDGEPNNLRDIFVDRGILKAQQAVLRECADEIAEILKTEDKYEDLFSSLIERQRAKSHV